METPITARSCLTWDDYRSALKLHGKTSAKATTTRPARILLWLVSVTVIGLLVYTSFGDRNRQNPPVVPDENFYFALKLALIAFAVLVGLIILYRLALRRQFANLTEDQRNQSWTIDEDGLLEECPMVEASYRWSHFRKVVESADLFLLYSADQMFQILPTRAFPSAEMMARFASVASERSTSYVVFSPCRYPAKAGRTGLEDF